MKRPLLAEAGPVARVDYGFLSRGFLYFGLCLLFVAPSAHDPAAFVAGALTPWLLLTIVNSPTMPAAVGFFLIWQWAQTFSRALLTLVDGESMSSGIYGPDVGRAYWYMLTSLVVLALAFRAVMGGLRAPSWAERTSYLDWRPVDLFISYIGAQVLNMVSTYAKGMAGSLEQQLEQVQYFKIIALFLLFANVLSSGRGRLLLIVAVGIEIVSGFSGLLGGFRGVFIVLAVAALAARLRWSPTMAIGGVVWGSVLVVLALFWTAIKQDYRHTVTLTDDAAQYIKVPVSERLGIIGGKAANAGNIDWETASYDLLYRFAYVDIFGSVIGVQENSPEKDSFMRQWNDAFEHVFKPRVLFPDKAALSDTEVYLRLAHGDMNADILGGTSISVGYIGENFADFAFPGMLAGIFMLGFLAAVACRWFMTQRLPWMVRESLAFGLLFSIGHDGVEISLPKYIGGTVMYFILYALVVRFAAPFALRWLYDRAALGQPQLSRPAKFGAATGR
jgi:hypothetical protein